MCLCPARNRFQWKLRLPFCLRLRLALDRLQLSLQLLFLMKVQEQQSPNRLQVRYSPSIHKVWLTGFPVVHKPKTTTTAPNAVVVSTKKRKDLEPAVEPQKKVKKKRAKRDEIDDIFG